MIYALLVGIDAYRAPLTPLEGCVADVRAIEASLRQRVSDSDLSLRTLLDAAATRDAIISAFQEHLGRARHGDHAVFYYSGHGSQERVPIMFAHLEPDGRSETFVCADSRHGVPDLADRELVVLIGEVAAGGASVVLLLDSCHSDSATRSGTDAGETVRARSVPCAESRRSPGSYLQGSFPGRTRDGSPEAGPRHTVLAACEPFQTAKELSIGGTVRGVFTVALCEALVRLSPTATYGDLTAAVRARVGDRITDQDPRLFVDGGARIDAAVLDAILARSRLTINHRAGRWWLNAGAVDGLAPEGPGGAWELTVFADGPELGSPLGTATVVGVAPGQSEIAVTWYQGDPDESKQYAVTVARSPVHPLQIDVTGDTGFVERVTSALSSSSALTTTAPGSNAPGMRFLITDESDRIHVSRGDRSMVLAVPRGEGELDALKASLEHLALWLEFRDRDDPGSTLAGKLRVDLYELEPNERTVADRPPLQSDVDGYSVHYRGTGAGGTPPRVLVRITNNGPRRIECGVVGLSDRYASQILLRPEWIEGRRAVERVVTFSIPASRMVGQRAAKAADWLKVVAATTEFSLDSWLLDPLIEPDTRRSRTVSRDAVAEGPLDTPGVAGAWTSIVIPVTTRWTA